MDQVVEVHHWCRVELSHDVIGLQAGASGWRVRGHVDDAGATIAGELQLPGFLGCEVRVEDNAEVGAADPAVLQQVVDDPLDHAAGDAECDSRSAPVGRCDGGVDSHDSTSRVNQRATAVSGIDGRVGLQEILIDDITGPEFQAPAPLGADDSQ